ncbi:DNA primase [Dactylosporangium sp. CA-052675]|uniref:DNA primase n=1 Tax=Dactylosporangium sp. CA-052675 TaxID=3239927 RepID=UPI003D920D99
MAGKIKDEDIALVRERTSIEDVISEHVTLRSAGGGNLKGLCPFHDEKTASFNVSPTRNVYFCHGCGAGGDAIKFLMDHDHLSFVESVERLASKAGLQLHYVEAGSAPVRPSGQKHRLIAAHAEAARFYAAQLGTPGARKAREFLAQRGFSKEAAERYGCGFAPEGWDNLAKHLRVQGFSAQELTTAGLCREGRSGGLIDRFRRRLVWPIKDISGEVIGFGARKLFDDDDGPKYLNTPETPLYKKSHVLYGIDQAKREIAKQSRVVIVEGYTDVMACHLAGVPVAVATCGTAFGGDHISVLRRLLMDADGYGGEIIFTFDGDAAGQKAALRAFEDDQRFVAQTFIAVGPDNMDPCELRLAKGDAAVRDLVADRQPLLDFALRSVIQRFDLDTAEGRVGALRATAPLVAKIKDRTLRPEYARKLAGDLGMELETVQRSVASAAKGVIDPMPPTQQRRVLAPDSAEALVEREALKLALQQPALAGPMFDAIGPEMYTHPTYSALRTAVLEAGGASSATGGAVWIEQVREACLDLAAGAMVAELAVEPLRLDGDPDPRYVEVTINRLQLMALNRTIGELKSKLQRINPVSSADEHLRLFSELVSLEQHARALRDRGASRW